MAINSDNALDCNHAAYCGASGSGKGVALKLGGMLGSHVALFDIYKEYTPSRIRKLSGLGNGRRVHHYTTRRGFLRAFTEAWTSGKRFAVAYAPNVKKSEYKAEAEWFGRVMWAASDGKRRLDVVFEEMAKYMDSTGKDNGIIGEIATGGRKFAIHAHFLFQRPEEVPKNIINQCRYLWVAAQQTRSDAKAWADRLDCHENEIVELGRKNTKRKKHYLFKSDGIGNYSEKVLSF